MMRSIKRSIILLAAFLTCTFAAKAQLTEYELLGSYNEAALEQLKVDLNVPDFFISVDHEVDVYKLTYQTPDPQGNITIATGAVCIPQGASCALPLTSYQHGTVAGKMDVPSAMSGELNIGLLLSTTGYVVALPDYLGLGDSPGLHPYVHAKSEGTACLDMLRAVRDLSDEVEFFMNDQLMIYGYSQGGHATMALHKEIQENASDEFEVTVSIPMSGPYDISGVQADVIVRDEFYPTPGYLPYVILAYNEVYGGGLYDDISEVLKPPYDQTLPPLFDGNFSMGFINSQCPDIPNQILQDTLLENFRNDPNHRFRTFLRDNDLYEWSPIAPVVMLYCEGDDQVNFMNSVVALDEFQSRGLDHVEARNLGDGDHSECFTPAIFACKTILDQYRILDLGVDIDASISNEEGSIDLVVNGGFPPFTFDWSNGAIGASLSDLAAGVYTVTITDNNGCQDFFNFEVEDPSSILGILHSPLVLSPNPASRSQASSIVVPDGLGVSNLQIFNSNGKLVFENEFEAAGSYELPILNESGVYLVKLQNEESTYLAKWLNY